MKGRTAARRVVLATSLSAAAPLWVSAQEFPRLDATTRPGAGRIDACTIAGVGGNARCGRFRVWENRENRRGRAIDIALVVLDATSSATRVADGVVLLPGGPGETFTDAAGAAARNWSDVRRTRDILLIDVRGVGRSQALDCDVPYPGGFRSRFGSVFPLAHVTACRDSLRRRADLTQYTTAASVDDIDEIRAWLGYRQLNLIGGSYGTRVAQVYMRRHPSSVRTAVLNGVAPIAEPLYVQHARLLQRALDRVVSDCMAEARCRAAQPDLPKQLETLLDRFRRGPATVDLLGQRVSFSLGDLSYALRGLLYNRAADVPRLVARAAAGDVLPLAEYYEQRTRWISDVGGSAGYHFSVLCAEDIAPLTDHDVTSATANTFMGAHLINSYRAVCAQWPYARLPAAHWTPVRSDIPTLLLSGGRDPVTPPEGAEAVAKQLSRAAHVVMPNGGHGVGGACIRRMIVTLLDTASLDRIDRSCVPR